MGLHTGEPTVGDEGYLGLDVVRAARICSAGHGGQILLSETTRALLGNDLPEGVERPRSRRATAEGHPARARLQLVARRRARVVPAAEDRGRPKSPGISSASGSSARPSGSSGAMASGSELSTRADEGRGRRCAIAVAVLVVCAARASST